MEIADPLEMGRTENKKFITRRYNCHLYIGGKYLNSVPIFKRKFTGV
jgi:hypothetical protein